MNDTKHTILSILLLLFLVIPTIAFAQNEDNPDKQKYFPHLFELNKSVSVGIIGGLTNPEQYGAMGFNATFYGVYVDFMGWPTKHGGDVRVGQWEDHSNMSFHVGYQIPFFQYAGTSIRLIPMAGYSSIKKGIVDGYDWSAGDGQIYNKFNVTEEKGGFDYGGALAFQGRDGLLTYNFYLGATRHTLWVGLAWEFQFKNLKKKN